MWNAANTQRLRDLAAEDKYADEIAAILGIRKDSVTGKANRLDIKIKSREVPTLHRPYAGRPQMLKPGAKTLPPLPSCAGVNVLPLSIFARPKECQWPIETGGHPRWRYCEEPVGPAGPYCPAHTRRAWQSAS